jgi:hypothetical protein
VFEKGGEGRKKEAWLSSGFFECSPGPHLVTQECCYRCPFSTSTADTLNQKCSGWSQQSVLDGALQEMLMKLKIETHRAKPVIAAGMSRLWVKKLALAGCQWLTPVIRANQEAKIRRIMVPKTTWASSS